MVHRLLAPAAAVAVVVALGGACTRPGHDHPHRSTTTSTTTTTRGTIPIDGWAITGVTRNQYCGGAVMPDQPFCRTPQPASDAVTVSQGTTVVAKVTSGTDGSYRIPVGPGTYTVQASTGGVPSQCAPVTVVISGPPVPKTVDLLCTINVP